jgi:NADPH:quinone reductase
LRAVLLSEFGPPDVLVPIEAPEPAPGAGQVVIDVAFANLTFVETQFRATGLGPFKPELPLIPGNGVGGTVASAGTGADPAWIGKRVVSSTGGSGGYAERAAGAEVVAVAGGARKLAVARDVGAHVAIDYGAPGWTESVGAVDVVFDGVGGATGRAAFELLGRGGRMLSFGLASGEWAGISEDTAAARGVTLVRAQATPEQMRGFTETALAEAAAGRLRPVIGQRFPLARAADAHAALAARETVGKTLLDVT